jgi:DNA mismatch repair protein MutS
VAVSEEDGRVVFLHRILPGSADRSYGVQVARLAGLPPAVTNRAWEILTELESHQPSGQGLNQTSPKQVGRKRRSTKSQGEQLSLMSSVFTADFSQELLDMDLSSMTPLEALNKLYALQQAAQGLAQDMA